MEYQKSVDNQFVLKVNTGIYLLYILEYYTKCLHKSQKV